VAADSKIASTDNFAAIYLIDLIVGPFFEQPNIIFRLTFGLNQVKDNIRRLYATLHAHKPASFPFSL